MNSFRFRMARWVVAHRVMMVAAFVLVTIGLGAGIQWVQIKTIFKNLLPLDDPFVQVYYDHPNFGNPLTVAIMVQARQGTIYDQKILQLVWDLSRGIDLTPGVNHDSIMSIASAKLRYAQATPEGINMRPLMGKHVPNTPEEVADFKTRIDESPAAHTFFVSPDASATLIEATFLDSVDYGKAFAYCRQLVESARAKNPDVNIYLAGEPILIGWVYKLQHQTYMIFAITLLLLTMALIFYMRNVAGVVAPIVCAAVAGVWAFGFIGWMHKPIEPLLMIIPLLLVSRTFSHCIQYTERYYEILYRVKDKRLAAEITLGVMVAPSVLGVFTDVFGISFVALAPIVTLYNHALFCGMWAFFIIPTGVYLLSVLLPWLPAPKNIERIAGGAGKETGFHLALKNFLLRVSKLTHGRAAWATLAVIAVITGLGVYEGLQIKIGNPVEGSNLLWASSPFNVGVRRIDREFPGLNTLVIVLEAKHHNPQDLIARSSDAATTSAKIQAMMEAAPKGAPAATLSFNDYMMEGNRLFSGGNPKWLPLDSTEAAAQAAATAISLGSSPITFNTVAGPGFQDSAVTLFYKNRTQETIDASLAAARKAVKAVGVDHKDFRVRLGSGTIALQEAMNKVVERYHWVIMLLLDLAIIVFSTIAYRSIVAALILMVPVNMANFLLLAVMKMIGIGFDIDSLIVAVLGVGVGIDYGIYLLSRICEEYNAQGRDWGRAIDEALTTTGKAIVFTATVMKIGIIPWIFLSDLKFMADMGILLVMIMFINMVLALIVLPLVVWFVKPRFVTREDLAIGEHVDLSQFTARAS